MIQEEDPDQKELYKPIDYEDYKRGNLYMRKIGLSLVLCALMLSGMAMSAAAEDFYDWGSGEEETEKDPLDSRIYELYQNAREGGAAETGVQAPLAGKLVFVTIRDDEVVLNSIKKAQTQEDFYSVSADVLATSLEEADAVVIIEEEKEVTGYYQGGGNAYRTTTNLLMLNPATGALYSNETVAANDPPESINLSNGINGYGKFEVEKAVDLIMERRAQLLAGTGEEPDTEGNSNADTGNDMAAILRAPDESVISRILELLEMDSLKNTREFLQGEETVGSGFHGDAGSGVQEMLVSLGCEITVDGAVGAQTISALQQVQESLGLPATDSIDRQLFDALLPLILMTKDEEAADELLRDFYDEAGSEGCYEYIKGRAYELQGRYYAAKEAYENSRFKDSQERAASCEQAWPENGELWHNPEVTGSDTQLTFHVNSANSSQGMCFHLYTDEGKLTSVLFVTGSGSATATLPSGVYRIKAGTGEAWYGRKDAFGRNGSYEFMVFNEDDPEQKYRVTLESGMGYELSINVTSMSEGAEGVGSTSVDWDQWV